MAVLITNYKIFLQDPNDEGASPWTVIVRMPPLAVMDKLQAALHEEEEHKHKLGEAFMRNKTFREKASSTETLSRTDAINLIDGIDPANLFHETPAETKDIAIALITPYVNQPDGLLNDAGQTVTWDTIRECNPAYYRESMWLIANEVYDRSRGAVAVQRKKK
jgi:hypothetical protein